MASKHHDDWQSSKKTVLQRNAYMFDNELMSDVSLTCGESSRIFHAHKYVLATSSAVFYAMFYGDLEIIKYLINIGQEISDFVFGREMLQDSRGKHCT